MISIFKGAKSEVAGVGIRWASVLVGFFLTFYIGRTFGPSGNGLYALASQTALLVCAIVLLGTDVSAVRYFSSSGGRRLPRRVILLIFLPVVAAPAAICAAVASVPFLSALIDRWLGDAAFLLPIILLATVGRGAIRLSGAIMRSQSSFAAGQAVDALMSPLLLSLLLVTGIVSTTAGLLYAFAFVTVIIGAAAFAATLRYTARQSEIHDVPLRSLYKTGLPLFGANLSIIYLEWFALALAAAWLGEEEAGLFKVASQAASVTSISMMGLFAVYSTRLARASTASEITKFSSTLRSASMMSLSFGVPVALLIFIFSEPLLGLIGPDFRQAAGILRILLVGQVIFLIVGPAGSALAMMGKERTNLALGIFSIIAISVTAPIAVSHYQLSGLAAAVAVVMGGKHLLALIAVRKEIIKRQAAQYNNV